MQIRTKIWIEDSKGKIVYGLGRQRMLQSIRECGSIKAAAEQLGMSYRGIWARIRHSELRLGFALLDSKPGRGPDAGSTLTPEAVQLLNGFEKAERNIYNASDRSYSTHLESLF